MKDESQRPVINPKANCKNQALQDGASSLAPRPRAVTGLVGKEGYLPTNAYSPRLPNTSSLFSRKGRHTSTFWPIRNNQSVYKAAKSNIRLPETKWLSSDSYSGGGFLGFHLCSTKMTVSIPTKSYTKSSKMLHQISILVKEIAQFFGEDNCQNER